MAINTTLTADDQRDLLEQVEEEKAWAEYKAEVAARPLNLDDYRGLVEQAEAYTLALKALKERQQAEIVALKNQYGDPDAKKEELRAALLANFKGAPGQHVAVTNEAGDKLEVQWSSGWGFGDEADEATNQSAFLAWAQERQLTALYELKIKKAAFNQALPGLITAGLQPPGVQEVHTPKLVVTLAKQR